MVMRLNAMAGFRAALLAVVAKSALSTTAPLQAYPLITLSPLVAVYSGTDELFGSPTIHWGGFARTLTGLLRVDGATFCWMGDPTRTKSRKPVQTRRVVTATSTAYTFVGGGAALNVTFTSPLLPGDWDLLSQPASYVTLAVGSADGAAHAVQVLYGHTGELVADPGAGTRVVWERASAPPGVVADAGGGGDASSPVTALRVGAAEQAPLMRKGDNRMLTWGHIYLVLPPPPPGVAGGSALAGFDAIAATFSSSGAAPGADAPCPPGGAPVGGNAADPTLAWPTAAGVWAWGVPGGAAPAPVTFVVAVDELLSLDYYGVTLPPYWRRTLPPFSPGEAPPWGMLAGAVATAGAARAAAAAFDAAYASAFAAVGDGDGALVALAEAAFRQAMSQCVLAWHAPSASAWHLLREGAGDIATVDVAFPAAPLLLALSPATLAAQLRPTLEFCANRTRVPYARRYAMHDLGTWPVADRSGDDQEDMPAEETANMLIMAAAVVARTGGDAAWLAPYDAVIDTWGDYLLTGGAVPFPGAQLSSDDFAGVIVNGTNLGLKGVVGIAAYGHLLAARGDAGGADAAWVAAGAAGAAWAAAAVRGAGADAHVIRELGGDATAWATPYNALWLRALRLDGLLPSQDALLAQAAAWLDAHARARFGIPLLSGLPGVKTDWALWLGATAYTFDAPPRPSALSAFVFGAAVAAAGARRNGTAAADSGSRVGAQPFPDQWGLPLADYYSEATGAEWFWGRAVVGAVAAPLLVVSAAGATQHAGGPAGGPLAALVGPHPALPHVAAAAAAFARGRQCGGWGGP